MVIFDINFSDALLQFSQILVQLAQKVGVVSKNARADHEFLEAADDLSVAKRLVLVQRYSRHLVAHVILVEIGRVAIEQSTFSLVEDVVAHQ